LALTANSATNGTGLAVGAGLTALGPNAEVTLADSTVSSNTAQGAIASGSGVADAFGATMTLLRDTVSNNQSLGGLASEGGGIVVYGTGTRMTVDTTTVSGNLAFTQLGEGTLLPYQGAASGGGLNVVGGATASVVKSTFDKNTAVAGDGSGGQRGGGANGGGLFISNQNIDGT